MIKICNLNKTFDNISPIKDINLEINKGDVISILGPSGTGKSTLIRMINGLEKPTSGHIYFNDVDLTDKKTNMSLYRQKIGMVFQSFNLFNHKTVVENVMCGQIDLLKKDKNAAYQKAMILLERVGLQSHALYYPCQLSGGQQQRVAIARALAMDPEILLLDEPTSALDPTMVQEVLNVITSLAKGGMTMVIVTHDMHFARDVANRVVYLDEGVVYETGTPEEIFNNPKREKTIKFINQLLTYRFEFTWDKINPDKINEFLAKFLNTQNIANKQRTHFLSVFEEVIFELLSDKSVDFTRCIVELGYSVVKNKCTLSLFYDGKIGNLMGVNNDISTRIVKSYCDSIVYLDNDGELPHKMIFVIN